MGQHRSTQRKVPCGRPDEAHLTEDIIAQAEEFGRYGYRMVVIVALSPAALGPMAQPLATPSDDDDGLLINSGWHVNHKRVESI